MASGSADPIFLGFTAFETTAFCTSIIVAGYSLISNPKGRQTGFDQSEYHVYAGWRLGVAAIMTQVALMTAVVVQLLRQGDISGKTAGWVVALMLAPWAPLAGRVRATLSSAGRVRRMMQSRLTRNEISSIVRDRFKFGQRGIALPVIIYHAKGVFPDHPLAALLANPRLGEHIDALRAYANKAAQTSDGYALELGSLWAMSQSLQPSSIPKRSYIAWRIICTIDLMARLWTGRRFVLRADAMPEIRHVHERARFLDIADMLQQGGTISDSLMARSMHGKFCERCRLSTRGAVESYLESSERGHADLRAKLWLQDVGMNWQGHFERVIDVMWEAAFMDAKAMKVESDDEDKSPAYGDRGKVTTTKTLALLFLIIRSLTHRDGEHDTYAAIAAVIRVGPFSRVWWDRYWNELANRLESNDFGLEKAIPVEAINAKTPSHFKAALRVLIDEDMACIVDKLVRDPIGASLCSDEKCFLHGAKIVLNKY